MKGGNLGSLRSIGNYENYEITNKTLCVAIGFSGLGDTIVDGTMENRDRQMSSSLEYLPISIFYRNSH